TLDELTETARRLGYKPVAEVAKYPSRMMLPSGFVSIEKRTGEKKSKVISEFSKVIAAVRGEKTAAAATAKKR
ncbi:MAG: hypothetical protein OK457_06655, partial [Thaumarchaeota archaeon]|nr:hypothetical protein [Nitrososphaerota archaeon]